MDPGVCGLMKAFDHYPDPTVLTTSVCPSLTDPSPNPVRCADPTVLTTSQLCVQILSGVLDAIDLKAWQYVKIQDVSTGKVWK